jgi:hypothetical protein
MFSKIIAISDYRDLSVKLEGRTFQFRGGRYTTSNPQEIVILIKHQFRGLGYYIAERLTEQTKDQRELNRKEIIELATKLGFKGKVATEKTDTLIDFIKTVGGRV